MNLVDITDNCTGAKTGSMLKSDENNQVEELRAFG